MGTDTERYEQDFYRWTQGQAALLKARQFDALDLANLIEEITALGVSERRALGSHLRNLVMHLLKWQHQPSEHRRGHSWRSGIVNARDEIAALLEDSPSLRAEVPALLTRRYPAARMLARDQTRLPLTTFSEVPVVGRAGARPELLARGGSDSRRPVIAAPSVGSIRKRHDHDLSTAVPYHRSARPSCGRPV